MENIIIISKVIQVLGLVMIIMSLVAYIKRTGDYSALTKFWASKAVLVKFELALNRMGLVVFIGGILLPIVSSSLR